MSHAKTSTKGMKTVRPSVVLSVAAIATLTAGGIVGQNRYAQARQIRVPEGYHYDVQNRSLERMSKHRATIKTATIASAYHGKEWSEKAREFKQKLVQYRLRVVFTGKNADTLKPWVFSVTDHPAWLSVVDGENGEFKAVINEPVVLEALRENPIEGIRAPKDCTVTGTFRDHLNILRATTDCTASAGFSFDNRAFIDALNNAIASNLPEVHVATAYIPGTLVTTTQDVPGVQLLATGRSNFKGSALGRIGNVKKGLREKINNIVVPAGETFSFNAMLGNDVSTANGWYMALGIFNGGDLRPVPGGGICQTSTTLYRSVLQAGLPIAQLKNHSLYVSYYEEYGVGQDATIYPGQQDFRFVNDTGHPILLQAYEDGFDAYVHLYGVDDGRTVTVDGPYFSKNAPADLKVKGRPLNTNQIAWVRTTEYADGTVKEDVVVSTYYKGMPRKLADRWIAKMAEEKNTTISMTD